MRDLYEFSICSDKLRFASGILFSSKGDSQGNFAVGVTRLTELVRAARFAERKDAIDCRREFARVDDLRDLSELSTARVASHKCGADAEFFGFLFRGRLD